jgi:hypothetical protein
VLRRRPGHRHDHRARLALGLGAAFLAAGCGGEDPAEQPYPPGVSEPIEKVEFVREADRICHAGDARIEAAADDLLDGGGEPPPGQVRRLARAVVIPQLEGEVRAIAAIPVPAGDEREVERIIAATERAIAQLRSDPAALADGPPAGLRQAGRLARAYGSEQCGLR